MKQLLLATVLLCVSCGSGSGDSPSPADKLQGSWGLDVGGGEVIGITFVGDHDYEFDDIAYLTDGSIGMMVELGAYDATENTLTFRPMKWSCAGPYPAYTVNYSVTASNLVVLSGSQITTLGKITPTGGGITARIGCFFDDGSFTQQAIAPL